jgi:hypothetical protein
MDKARKPLRCSAPQYLYGQSEKTIKVQRTATFVRLENENQQGAAHRNICIDKA